MLRGGAFLAGGTGRAYDDVSLGQVDQGAAGLGLVSPSPPAFQPFRFEPRRARIDWRLLHGVDVNNIVSVLCVRGAQSLAGLSVDQDFFAEGAAARPFTRYSIYIRYRIHLCKKAACTRHSAAFSSIVVQQVMNAKLFPHSCNSWA